MIHTEWFTLAAFLDPPVYFKLESSASMSLHTGVWRRLAYESTRQQQRLHKFKVVLPSALQAFEFLTLESFVRDSSAIRVFVMNFISFELHYSAYLCWRFVTTSNPH